MLLGWNGVLGTVLWWYLGALVVFFVITRDRTDGEQALDRIVTVLMWSAGVVVSSILVWMIVFLITKGLPALTGNFFVDDMSKVGSAEPGRGREARAHRHARAGRAGRRWSSVPVAMLTAVYLHEIGGRLSRPVRFIVDAMSGLPSIIAGLLIFTVWVDGRGFSGLAGAAALAVLMLPTVTRTSEEIFRTIPDTLREGALALGAPQWRLIVKVVIPTALAGLVTAAILGDRSRRGRDRADAAHRVRLGLHEHEPALGRAVGPAAVRVEADPAAQPDPDRPGVERRARPGAARPGPLRDRPCHRHPEPEKAELRR